jgi:hypothetical protein
MSCLNGSSREPRAGRCLRGGGIGGLDLTGTDNTQLTKYQTKFPVLWEHPAVKGRHVGGLRGRQDLVQPGGTAAGRPHPAPGDELAALVRRDGRPVEHRPPRRQTLAPLPHPSGNGAKVARAMWSMGQGS